jgi:hypothetical protein
MMVAALFVRKDSIYKTMSGVDAWDKERDATKWPGGDTIVAHPPCAQWGALAHFATVDPNQKYLAIWAVETVREWGGVLEHPKASRLWDVMGLPPPGYDADKFGGWTLGITQHWWGHEAEKATLLYIVGCAPADIPPIPMVLGEAERTLGKTNKRRKELLKSKREHTPPELAAWLVELAGRCTMQGCDLANTTEKPGCSLGSSQSAKS